jgi:hypothetical protein
MVACPAEVVIANVSRDCNIRICLQLEADLSLENQSIISGTISSTLPTTNQVHLTLCPSACLSTDCNIFSSRSKVCHTTHSITLRRHINLGKNSNWIMLSQQ